MDKTSKLFLREQIRRIRNLNGRIESGDFILENITPELEKSLEALQTMLVQKLASVKSADIDKVKPFISDVILNDLLKSKEYCGDRGKVDCVNISDYYNVYFKDIDLTNIDDVVKGHKYIINNLLKGNTQSKIAEILSKELGKTVSVPPTILDDNEIQQFLSLYEPLRGDLIKYNLVSNYDKFIKGMGKLLKKGEFCKKFNHKGACTEGEMIKLRNLDVQGYKDSIDEYNHLDGMVKDFIQRVVSNKDEIKQTKQWKDSDFDAFVKDLQSSLMDGSFFRKEYPNIDLKNDKEVKKAFLLYLQKLKQDTLRPRDLKKLLDYYDKEIYAGLAANTSEEFAKSARNDFKEKLESGTFCEDCENRQEIQKEALKAMKLLLKYSDAEIPKGMGKFDFLQDKIEKLLVVNRNEDTKDEDTESISVEDLLRLKGKEIKISYEPNATLKKDPNLELREFIGKGVLSGNCLLYTSPSPRDRG